MILFVCVSANHLGLVKAIEKTIGIELPIINCCKCFSFWFTLFYLELPVLERIAVSFLSAYLAVWLELGMGFIDALYNKIYDKIYSTEDKQIASDADEAYPDGGLS